MVDEEVRLGRGVRKGGRHKLYMNPRQGLVRADGVRTRCTVYKGGDSGLFTYNRDSTGICNLLANIGFGNPEDRNPSSPTPHTPQSSQNPDRRSGGNL